MKHIASGLMNMTAGPGQRWISELSAALRLSKNVQGSVASLKKGNKIVSRGEEDSIEMNN